MKPFERIKNKQRPFIGRIILVMMFLIMTGIYERDQYQVIFAKDKGGNGDAIELETLPPILHPEFMSNIQNGGLLAYDMEGFCYYRSQADHYAFYKSTTDGDSKVKLTDEVPRNIIVGGRELYFVNDTDGGRLYKIGTDGSNLQKITEEPVRSFVLIEDTLYYLLNQIPSSLYSIKVDGTDRKSIINEDCKDLTTDGKHLYVSKVPFTGQEFRPFQYEKDKKEWRELPFKTNLVIGSHQYLYYINDEDHFLYKADADTLDTEVFLEVKISGFILTDTGVFYSARERNELYYYDKNSKDIDRIFNYEQESLHISDLYIFENRLCYKNYVSSEIGQSWFYREDYKGDAIVFDEPDPITDVNSLVRLSSGRLGEEYYNLHLGSSNFPQREDLIVEDFYYIEKQGIRTGEVKIILPQFESGGHEGVEKINQSMQQLMAEQQEYGEALVKQIEETINHPASNGYIPRYFSTLNYETVYAGKYLMSIFTTTSGGTTWENTPNLMTFDLNTGEQISMDQLFSVDRNHYRMRIATIISQYCELLKLEDYPSFNQLIGGMDPDKFMIDQDCFVVCYPGDKGDYILRIPLEQLKDIYRYSEAKRIRSEEELPYRAEIMNNMLSGGLLAYDVGGNYYYQSQADLYALYQSTPDGRVKTKVTDAIARNLILQGDTIFFINDSDGGTLYKIKTDGSEPEQITDYPVSNVVLAEDALYFFKSSTAEGDIYTIEISRLEEEAVYVTRGLSLTTDGEHLFYGKWPEKSKSYEMYQYNIVEDVESKLPFSAKTVICNGNELYYINYFTNHLYKADLETLRSETIIDVPILDFSMSESHIYYRKERDKQYYNYDIKKKTSSVLFYSERYEGDQAEKINLYMIGDQVFYKNFASSKTGDVWFRQAAYGGKPVIFDEMEPIRSTNPLVWSLGGNGNLMYNNPSRVSASHLNQNDLIYEDMYYIEEDGIAHGTFTISYPQFDEAVSKGMPKINEYFQELAESQKDDRFYLFTEIQMAADRSKEHNAPDYKTQNFFYTFGYGYTNIGENYLSVRTYRNGCFGYSDAGFYLPEFRNFNLSTGVLLTMDDLFSVERKDYMSRIAAIIYKNQELLDDGAGFPSIATLSGEHDPANFMIDGDRLFLYYPKHAMGSEYENVLSYEIPLERLKDIYQFQIGS